MNKIESIIVHRCDNPQCREIIKNTKFSKKITQNKKMLYFCDEWCAENTIYKEKKEHKCVKCGLYTKPYMRLDKGRWWTSSGIYHSHCDECKKKIKMSSDNMLVNKDRIGK